MKNVEAVFFFSLAVRKCDADARFKQNESDITKALSTETVRREPHFCFKDKVFEDTRLKFWQKSKTL